MKVLMLNFSDIQGGASRAAYRLHLGLNKIGFGSQMLVQSKGGDDFSTQGPEGTIAKGLSRLRRHVDRLPLEFYKNRKSPLFSLAWLPENTSRRIDARDPDLLHLHWICNGFISIAGLSKIRQPLLWTLHDCWAFTGGCHYPLACTRYQESCGSCPQLGSATDRDLSRWVWKRKTKHWQSLNITIVTPSRWLAQCAEASSLFRRARIEVIPNGLDLKRYKPLDRPLARDFLGLPDGKKLILCGTLGITGDQRKGFRYLQSAIGILAAGGLGENAMLLVFGASEPPNPMELGLKTEYLGTLHDDISLALLYAAADVFVAPSIQDNLPNMVMEALACGTPTVAFDIGGMPDLIDHLQTGYLAKPFEPADLARGIDWVLSDEKRYLAMRSVARAKVEREFEITHIANRYVGLYKEILGRGTGGELHPGATQGWSA